MKEKSEAFIQFNDAIAIGLMATLFVSIFFSWTTRQYEQRMLLFVISFVFSSILLCVGTSFAQSWRAGGIDRKLAPLWTVHFGYVCVSFALVFLMPVFSWLCVKEQQQFAVLFAICSGVVFCGITLVPTLLGITARLVAGGRGKASTSSHADRNHHEGCARNARCTCCVAHRKKTLQASLPAVVTFSAALPMVALFAVTIFMFTDTARQLEFEATKAKRQLEFEMIKKQLDELNRQSAKSAR